MKCLLLAPLLLGLISSANAGISYYPNYSEKGGIIVVCANGKASHIVELKAGRTKQKNSHSLKT